MSVISFWNALEKENGQTCSALAIATYMAMEHNLRILLIDGTFDDQTTEKAFWKKKVNKTLEELTGGQVDISSGAEGLVSAIASNKASPEVITNYTKVVFKNRLDILPGLKTKVLEDHEKSMMLYKTLVEAANKFYDMVFIDLPKGTRRPSAKAILDVSDIIVYACPPNLTNLDKFVELKDAKNPYAVTRKTIPLLAKSDERSAYNLKNTKKYIKERYEMAAVPYNVRFMESVNESRLASFMTSSKLSKAAVTVNGSFFDEIDRDCNIILDRIKELQNQ